VGNLSKYILIATFLLTCCNSYAFDLGCGVNYFNGWCDRQKADGNGEKRPDNQGSQPFDPYWTPPNTPPVAAAFFHEPTADRAQQFIDWETKRNQRLDEMGKMIMKLSPKGDSKPPQSANTLEFSKAVYFFQDDCPHCARMTPLLAEFQNSGRPIIPIGIKLTDAQARDYIAKAGLNLPASGDPEGKYVQGYKVVTVPSLILMTSDNVVVMRYDTELDRKSLQTIFNNN